VLQVTCVIGVIGVLRRESNDFLLPVLITFLNNRDWPLRSAFFSNIACLGSAAGPEGLEAFLLPCLEQVLGGHGASVCMSVSCERDAFARARVPLAPVHGALRSLRPSIRLSRHQGLGQCSFEHLQTDRRGLGWTDVDAGISRR
jgi:hypothetical protein